VCLSLRQSLRTCSILLLKILLPVLLILALAVAALAFTGGGEEVERHLIATSKPSHLDLLRRFLGVSRSRPELPPRNRSENVTGTVFSEQDEDAMPRAEATAQSPERNTPVASYLGHETMKGLNIFSFAFSVFSDFATAMGRVFGWH